MALHKCLAMCVCVSLRAQAAEGSSPDGTHANKPINTHKINMETNSFVTTHLILDQPKISPFLYAHLWVSEWKRAESIHE